MKTLFKTVIQNPYNLSNRSAEEELFPAADYEKMGIMTYSTLAAGLLSGAFAHGKPAPEKSTWGYDPVYQAYQKQVFPGKIELLVNAVSNLAEKYSVSSAAVATAWVLRNKQVICAAKK